MGQSISRTKLTVPTRNSGKAFVVTYYFVCVALSHLRDTLKFLLQEGQGLSQERRVMCQYIPFQHVSGFWPQRFPFML